MRKKALCLSVALAVALMAVAARIWAAGSEATRVVPFTGTGWWTNNTPNPVWLGSVIVRTDTEIGCNTATLWVVNSSFAWELASGHSTNAFRSLWWEAARGPVSLWRGDAVGVVMSSNAPAKLILHNLAGD